jgi:chromosome partitioning protein
MTTIIGIVSQKGGVGKSTIARLLAREYAQAGWNAKIADLDVAQGTSFNWQARRLRNDVTPAVAVERFGTVEQALRVADHYDLLILDGPPHSTAGTLRIAQASDIVILPSGLALDDLEPSVVLAQELVQKGVSGAKLTIAFCRVGDSEAELSEARGYVSQAGFHTITEAMPERVAYRRAFDQGRSATETPFASLNEKADAVAQSIINLINRSSNGATDGKDRTTTQAQHERNAAGGNGRGTTRQSRPARAR